MPNPTTDIAHGSSPREHPAPRVVSLLPSATEALCFLGGARMLVGRSHECDFPWGIERLPILTAQRTPAPSDPGAIDRAVREALAQGQSLYTIDEERVRELRPDVILTQDLCEVCSIDLAAVRRVAERMSPVPRIVSLNPMTVEAVIDDLHTIGRAVGLEREAREQVVALRDRLFSASEYVNPFADGPVVGFLEWTEPLFVGGHWTPQLIERAGGRHPLNATVAKATAGAAAGPQMAERVAGKSVRVPSEVFAATRPEYLIIAPCGMNLRDTRACAERLRGEAWFRSLPAVGANRVALVDGNQMFNRPGPRLAEAFEFLVAFLNDRPELIPEGFPWERM